jgi:hypothetical protein
MENMVWKLREAPFPHHILPKASAARVSTRWCRKSDTFIIKGKSRELRVVLTQQVSSEPEEKQQHISQPPPEQDAPFPRVSIISLLVIISLLLLLFAGLSLRNLPQAIISPATAGVPQSSQAAPGDSDQDDMGPLQTPGKTVTTPLQVPAGYEIVYEQQDQLYVVPATGGTPQAIATPGYIYSRSVPPILMPSGQLLYSGDGLWITNIYNGTPQQIATLPAGQVITSLALSRDGTTIAWSTEPVNGTGTITIYAGSLHASTPVYQHSASDCPCFRVFSFLNGAGQKGDTTLLLTDDRGDHEAVQYGLWLFDITSAPGTEPQELLGDDTPRSPLALSPESNNLLFSNYTGVVPAPSSGAPTDIAGLSYANSLSMTTIDGGEPLRNSGEHVILPKQHGLSNIADYHWVTTPIFSPDGHTLAYVEFSSDAQDPFTRHSALYTVQISGSGQHLHVGRRQLLATTSAHFVELGAWLNNRILTFYADGSLYALDIDSGQVATIIQTGTYSQIVAIVQQSAIQPQQPSSTPMPTPTK